MLAPANAIQRSDSAGHLSWTSLPALDRSARHSSDVQFIAAAGNQVHLLRLIADLASRLAAVEPDAIDDTIVESLRQVAEVLQLDRAIVWQRATDAMAGTFIASKLQAGEVVSFTRVDDVPDPAARETLGRHGFRSAVLVPMAQTGTVPAMSGTALAFVSTTAEHEWTLATIEQLRLVAGVFSQAVARQASLHALQQAQAEIRRWHERIPKGVEPRARTPYRPHDVPGPVGDGPIVGRSLALGRVLDQLRQVAATNSTVLLRGESGTGKELFATCLHELSARRQREMVRVNCSAIPSTLLESELFGREKGAFTGALARQIGRFELADRSTIFLDEIGDLPADVQVKLLRVLEERQIERLGNPKGIRVDVRIVAATHRNLEERIGDDTFREDLFYRLNVFPIHVPPLRERAEDIPLLVWRFVNEFARAFGKRIDAIPRDNMAALQQYAWPGNIRELRNVVERAMIVATGTELTIEPPAPSIPAAERSIRMADVERAHVRRVLESVHWRVRGAGGAAERLDLPPTTLESRMAKLGITRPKHP